MRFRKCTIFCILSLSLFVSLTLILLSVINEENELLNKLNQPRGLSEISETLDIRSVLVRPWQPEHQERLAATFIKRYSINRFVSANLSPWDIANKWATPSEIHPDFVPELGYVLESMSKRKIVKADVGHRGTQLKLTINFEDGQAAVFKPKWYERNFTIEGQPYEGHDRHNGEIAAFHLNRILGFRRAPLTTGRVLDLQKEIIPVATKKLKKTFFVRNEKDICFLGRCLYCKSEEDAACGQGTKMEGAVILWLPKSFTFTQFRHPWSRTYNVHRKAKWELTNNAQSYCSYVQESPTYRSETLILDIIDTSVFDFLIGNADRHHFEVITNQSDPILILFDNAKSFGNPNKDEDSILAPLLQCKFIRKSTVERLNQLKQGTIMRVFKAVLASDSLAPLLTDAHFVAVGRRLDAVVEILSRNDYSFV